jgi:uncharacterized protein DUF1360
MPLWLLVALMILATFRLTRLVVKDDFPPIAWARVKIQRLRKPVITHPPGESTNETWRWWWAGELVSCHWCSSAYVAAAVVGLTNVVHDFAAPVLVALAVWGAAAVLADRLG